VIGPNLLTVMDRLSHLVTLVLVRLGLVTISWGGFSRCVTVAVLPKISLVRQLLRYSGATSGICRVWYVAIHAAASKYPTSISPHPAPIERTTT
jgi:hypothetical protein